MIDTGSSYITGPASSISILMRMIGAVELAEGGVSSVHVMKSVTYIFLVQTPYKIWYAVAAQEQNTLRTM